MYIITIVFTGVAIGALARLVIAGPSFGSTAFATALGAAGALLAGLVGRWLGISGHAHPVATIAIAIVGAAAVLLIHRLMLPRRALP